MASIWPDARSGTYLIKFHYGGRRFTRSCQTDKERDAKGLKVLVEETIGLLNTGRLVMPDDVHDEGTWIMSGGKLERKPVLQSRRMTTLDEVCDAYLEDQRDKAPATLAGERIHVRHLNRVLGGKTQLSAVTADTLRSYVATRLQDRTRRPPQSKRSRKKAEAKPDAFRLVTPATVKKELTTFRQIWDWARRAGTVRTPCPLLDPYRPRKWAVSLPKPAQPGDFMTWAEIEQRIARGGLTSFQVAALWKRLFLDEQQVLELLDHVRRMAKHPFIHAMFAFAAYSGARRSEICRALIDDLNFEKNLVIIRERKRRKDLESSTRRVPMHPQLKEIMREWFQQHPGGQHAIVPPVNMPRRRSKPALDALTREEAHHHFKQTLANSKWKVIPGFHVLRHSFGAICTRAGVPMMMVAKWMGHTTQEMMTLYQHLFPADEQEWMGRLPFGTTNGTPGSVLPPGT